MMVELSMLRKPQVVVEPRPDGDGRFKQTLVNEPTLCTTGRVRPSAVGARAQNKQTELVIKGADGRIAGKDSHGADPRNIKG